MKLPTKSRYSVQEAVTHISTAVEHDVRIDQILDWGTQGLFKLYLPMTAAQIRHAGSVDTIHNQTVEVRLSPDEAASLAKGHRIGISKCWRDENEVEFVRKQPREYGGGYVSDTLYFGYPSIALVGAELDAFILSMRADSPAGTSQASSTSSTPFTPKAWQDAVREIANELEAIDSHAGAWSSREDMSERVAELAAKRGVRGPGEKILTAGNILREALTGTKWKRQVRK
jgi:hypothetical protein